MCLCFQPLNRHFAGTLWDALCFEFFWEQNRIFLGSFCSGAEETEKLLFPSVVHDDDEKSTDNDLTQDTSRYTKHAQTHTVHVSDWLEGVRNGMTAGFLLGFLFVFVVVVDLKSRSPACRPLWKTTQLFFDHTPQMSVPAGTKRGEASVWCRHGRDTQGVKVRSYFLWSFWTSLSSSSFSLVMKLCRTGISNLMYCATWWNRCESQAGGLVHLRQGITFLKLFHILHVLQCYLYDNTTDKRTLVVSGICCITSYVTSSPRSSSIRKILQTCSHGPCMTLSTRG